MSNGRVSNYRIAYNGDKDVNNVHHIGVEYNGNYFSVIFGEYVNGGFCSIPNWNVGCELAELDDVGWNKRVLSELFENSGIGNCIAQAIARFARKDV